MPVKSTYFGEIKESVQSLFIGLKRSFQHIRSASHSRKGFDIESSSYFNQQRGIETIQYPNVVPTVPDTGRYKLHNEIDDCIVCDKCAKICPVDCIDIEPIRSVTEIGKTSDGTSKRIYAAKFDIHLSKCCFCGLCTTVCPTECLTMTPEYDYSSDDIMQHTASFAELTPLEIIEKRKEWEAHQAQKEKQKAEKTKKEVSSTVKAKPSFKPKVRPKKDDLDKEENTVEENIKSPKPKFRPKIKPKTSGEASQASDQQKERKEDKPASASKPKFRPKIKPVIKKKPKDNDD